MGKYLKKFEDHTEYETYINGSDVILPNVSLCKNQNDVHYNPIPHNYANDYLTFVAKESGAFGFIPQNNNVISYSTDDGKTWTEGNIVQVNNGDKVLWKGTMTSSSDGIGTFSSVENFDIQGNAMSLLYGDNFKGQTSLSGKNYAFYNLFKNNTKVINAENLSLPATTLTNWCYRSMFDGCTNLTTAPELPATTLIINCYAYMFRGCTSLTTAPELPATTLASYCCQYMFQGCTSLTTAPELHATTDIEFMSCSHMFQGCTNLITIPSLPSVKPGNRGCEYMFADCVNLTTAPELPATQTDAECYYGMFDGCTSLTEAPELPAETLEQDCYAMMFYNCTSLTTAPTTLPATTLAYNCYYSMFYGCTSLETAPELPATTLISGCYSSMFRGCTSLNYIKAMFTTTPSSSYTSNWVSGVAATGTFVKNAAATWTTTGNSGIPNGWTVETASE